MERRQCFIFFLLSVIFFVFCELGACSSTEDDLNSCLATAGVQNFTTIDDPTYGGLVSLSIKNLRFTTPPSVIIEEPFAVILPEDTLQLASSIRCARAASYTIVLRSGGHSYEGFSSYISETSPFVVLDLMNLDRVTVDLETETAWVQGGATLGELYHAIGSSSSRHAFPAGMCPTVGVGGQFSGGGYGTLARKFGLSADNIVDATLVDAEGRVVDRNAMGEDVFWAIRGGGGGNWGAVAAWKIKLLQIPETVTAFRVPRTGSPAEMAKLWHKWQLFAADLEDEFFLLIYIVSKNETHGPGVVLNFVGVFLGTKESAFSSMGSAFPELNVGSDDLKEMTWLESVAFTSISDRVLQVNDLKDRFLYDKAFSKIKSDFVREPMTEDAIRGALEIIAEQPKGFLALDPYGGAMRRITSDAIAFPHRAGNLYSIDYLVQWQEEGDTESDICVRWLRRIHEYMTPYVSNEPRASYVNDVDLDLGTIDWNKLQGTSGVEAVEIARAWGEKYFLGNYDRLVRAKTMIDPRNVFRHPQSIPPIIMPDSASQT